MWLSCLKTRKDTCNLYENGMYTREEIHVKKILNQSVRKDPRVCFGSRNMNSSFDLAQEINSQEKQ